MNIGLIIGKKRSVSVPGKNIRKILGRSTCEYAFIAAFAIPPIPPCCKLPKISIPLSNIPPGPNTLLVPPPAPDKILFSLS